MYLNKVHGEPPFKKRKKKSFRLWPRSPVELNVKNLEKSCVLVSVHVSSISSELKCWLPGRPKVVSLMLYGSF